MECWEINDWEMGGYQTEAEGSATGWQTGASHQRLCQKSDGGLWLSPRL